MIDQNIDVITSDSYDHVRFVLSSELRLNILKLLFNHESCSLEKLTKMLNKQESNVSRAIKELQEKKLVAYDDKLYFLTSAGYLVSRNLQNFFDNWYTVNKMKECWDVHSIDNIPYYFSRYLYLWKDANIIKSDYVHYNKTLDIFTEKMKDAGDIRMILPIYSKYHMKAIIHSLIDNDTTLQLVTSRNILKAIQRSEFNESFERLRTNKRINIWTSDKDVHNLFYVISDDWAMLSLFYLDKSYDDSTMLIDYKKENMVIHRALFDDYKNNFKLI